MIEVSPEKSAALYEALVECFEVPRSIADIDFSDYPRVRVTYIPFPADRLPGEFDRTAEYRLADGAMPFDRGVCK